MINKLEKTREIQVKNFTIGGKQRFTLIAGPCAIENEEMSLMVAKKIKTICDKLGINYIFKSSFDKANRSSIHSYRGVGLEEGLRILGKVKSEVGVPVITDVHEPWQCEKVAKVVDMLQIPAFLCRQTDLIIAAGKTGLPVNVKKGQFLAPWDMKNVVTKMDEIGNERLLLTERGNVFGYNNFIVDMRGLLEMRKLGVPVVFDATHSVQIPGGLSNCSGGNREYVFPLMKAALSVGVDAIFAEVHPDPDKAPCDGPNMLYLDDLEEILETAIKIDNIAKEL
ncbi:MAG: 3-deoxy-8-phosphooctulonate synthase [Fusobacterium sp.]|uniref:3-deoxy-8-phosphooctulonate synthase n=1 Tax=Fusobacterium sp. IOR10 TaxID=2665157 RepID=UPI0013D024F4|nr:3-deoxy-8-phosphooctulonate synthase [Fusobacterium sp. IOR10]